jgi:hypothetical protein
MPLVAQLAMHACNLCAQTASPRLLNKQVW